MSTGAALHMAVFTAVTTALAGQADVIAGRLDPGQAWPAVHIGDVSAVSLDGINAQRTQYTITITTFSEVPGPVEVLNLMAAIRDGLHNVRLTVTEGSVMIAKVARETSQLDADGMTYTGTSWVEVITSP